MNYFFMGGGPFGDVTFGRWVTMGPFRVRSFVETESCGEPAVGSRPQMMAGMVTAIAHTMPWGVLLITMWFVRKQKGLVFCCQGGNRKSGYRFSKKSAPQDYEL